MKREDEKLPDDRRNELHFVIDSYVEDIREELILLDNSESLSRHKKK